MSLNRVASCLVTFVCLAACGTLPVQLPGDAGSADAAADDADGGHQQLPSDAGDGGSEDAGDPADAGDSADAGELADAGDPSDAGATDGGTPRELTSKEWMTRYVHAFCAPMTRCPNRGGDPSLCIAMGCHNRPSQNFGPQNLLKVVESGEVALDPVKFDACITAFENRPCEWFDVDSFEAYHACDGALTPLVAAGGACRADASCQAGLECVTGKCTAFVAGRCTRTFDCPQGEECTENGVCIATTTHAAGEHCSVTGTCDSGLVCVPPGNRPINEGYCRAMVGLGAACSSTAPCSMDYICMSGTCQLPYKEGDPCTSRCGWDLSDLMCGKEEPNQCLYLPKSGPCLGGVHCDLVTSYCDKTQATPTCVPQKKLGEECASEEECIGRELPSPITCSPDAQGVNRCQKTGNSRCE